MHQCPLGLEVAWAKGKGNPPPAKQGRSSPSVLVLVSAIAHLRESAKPLSAIADPSRGARAAAPAELCWRDHFLWLCITHSYRALFQLLSPR